MTQPDTDAAAAANGDLATASVRQIAVTRPLYWLRLGWRDFTRAFVPSALHGIVIATGGLVIAAVATGRFYLLAGALSGFLLVGPVLATGLYELSRRLAAGKPATLGAVFAAWRSGWRCVLDFGLILMVVGTFWVLVSALLIALFADATVTNAASFLREVVLARDSHFFEGWMALGGMLAALVFAGSVVSIPMMLDRDVGLPTAVLSSVQAVAANPIALAFWATIIMLLTALGMATLFVGLIVIVPVLGHASWHAYAELLDTSALPARSPHPVTE
jgi:uncharacterized membrane protein